MLRSGWPPRELNGPTCLECVSVHSDYTNLDTFDAQVQQSPSHYSTPTVPADLSGASSVLLSPNRVQPDISSGSSDRDPVFEVFPDTTGLLLPSVPESTVESLPQAGVESCFPHQIDGALSYNLGLMDSGSNVPLVTIPIYPLPAGMVLLPVPPSGQPTYVPLRSPEWVQWSPATPPTRDVSREGPFDAYCSPMDTGDHPLVSAGLPGYPYHISSYTACCCALRPFGFRTWIGRTLSRQPSTSSAMPACLPTSRFSVSL